MFTRISNASKYALIMVTKALKRIGFTLIDCQIYTPHLERFGARGVPRHSFLAELNQGLQAPTKKGKWTWLFEHDDREMHGNEKNTFMEE